ncbi:hypothetical protein TNCV_325631 [Trichonephila clavipes]|nr:hypothetical protein TNCV_325631 [Trichonephila clavipes]
MAEAHVDPTEKEFSYICHQCRKRFKNTRHCFIAISSDETEFMCVKCEITFARGFKVNKSDFDDGYPHRCEDCGIGFPTSIQLSYHSYRHSNNWPFRCHFCQKGFSMNCQLKRHLSSRTVQCSQCSAIFQEEFCPKQLFHENNLKCEKCSSGFAAFQYLT